MYETFVRHQIGSKTVSSLKKTDIKRFYNYLTDERQLKPSTIDSIHTVLHQILDMAVDDDYIRNNPSDNVLRELKQAHCFKTEKRRALTRPEQELFLSYLKNTPAAQYWYPIFAVLVGTGLRVGELTGLRWCDVDLENGVIDVNHTLVYYDHRTDGSLLLQCQYAENSGWKEKSANAQFCERGNYNGKGKAGAARSSLYRYH